jgi:hypothetical protein
METKLRESQLAKRLIRKANLLDFFCFTLVSQRIRCCALTKRLHLFDSCDDQSLAVFDL